MYQYNLYDDNKIFQEFPAAVHFTHVLHPLILDIYFQENRRTSVPITSANLFICTKFFCHIQY